VGLDADELDSPPLVDGELEDPDSALLAEDSVEPPALEDASDRAAASFAALEPDRAGSWPEASCT